MLKGVGVGGRQKPEMGLSKRPNLLSQDQTESRREDRSVEGRLADDITGETTRKRRKAFNQTRFKYV